MHPVLWLLCGLPLGSCQIAPYVKGQQVYLQSLSELMSLPTMLHETMCAIEDELVPLIFEPLSLGSITSSGWLRYELQTEANGLAGHEYDFYQHVKDSKWLGGCSEIGHLNEDLPYWFNGLVPLAYGLNDERLKNQVHVVAASVLASQSADGWLGPEEGSARNFWGRYPLVMGLTQLVEANASWEEPIISALYKFNTIMHEMMSNNYTGYVYHEGDILDPFNYHWGRVRAQDMMISLMWLYEKHPRVMQDVLLDNLNFLYNGSLNWAAWYNEASYIFDDLGNTKGNDVNNPNFAFQHGVNVGQGLKAAAVYRRLTHNDSLINTAVLGVNWTFAYHGAASGTVLADERLQGLKPHAGSELCTAVETIYSLSYLYQALGKRDFADRAELTTFNALPTMMTSDWWGHQYMAQPNQPFAKNLADDQNPFYNANGASPTFGVEPGYPCCAVNHIQGLPKFLSNTYVAYGPNGIVHALLSPTTVNTTVAGGRVTIFCTTDYPFSNVLSYSIETNSNFYFYVRVPGWATKSSSITLDDRPTSSLYPDSSNGLHTLTIPAGTHQVTYHLNSDIRTAPRANDTVCVYHGSLLYALEIGIKTVPIAETALGPPASRGRVELYNTTAWNYAIDPSTMQYRTSAKPEEPLKLPVFAPGNPPNYIEVKGCQIEWPVYNDGDAGLPPPASSRRCIAKTTKTLRLVPYGSAKLHMADLPIVDLSRSR